MRKNFLKDKLIINDNDKKIIFKEVFGYDDKKFTYKEIFEIIFGKSKYFKEINDLLKLENDCDEFWLHEKDFNLNDYLEKLKK